MGKVTIFEAPSSSPEGAIVRLSGSLAGMSVPQCLGVEVGHQESLEGQLHRVS